MPLSRRRPPACMYATSGLTFECQLAWLDALSEIEPRLFGGGQPTREWCSQRLFGKQTMEFEPTWGYRECTGCRASTTGASKSLIMYNTHAHTHTRTHTHARPHKAYVRTLFPKQQPRSCQRPLKFVWDLETATNRSSTK